MKNIILFVLAAMWVFQSCTQSAADLEADNSAQQFFSNQELRGIEAMIGFVDKKVTEQTGIADVNRAYHNYFEGLQVYIKDGKMFPALVSDSLRSGFLGNLNREAFSAIWQMTDERGLTFRNKSSYLAYLEQTAATDEKYNMLHESITIAGDMGPAIVAWFPMHHNEFDFTIFKDRLLAVAFILRCGGPRDDQRDVLPKETTEN